MALRTMNDTVRQALLENDEFILAHLIKFEKPKPQEGTPTGVNDFVYLTDAPFPLTLDSIEYRPARVMSIGTVKENLEAKAGQLSIKLGASDIGTTVTETIDVVSAQYIDLKRDALKTGFKVGDVIKLEATSSGAHDNLELKISSIRSGSIGNERIYGTVISTSPNSLVTETGVEYKITTENVEVKALLSDSLDITNASYIHRQVTIYRAFINPKTGAYLGNANKVLFSSGVATNNPFTLFKGNISKGTIQEDVTKGTTVTWNLTDHWGDFIRVGGRRTSDADHRALGPNGVSDLNRLPNPNYQFDYGFEHSEKSINAATAYTRREQRTSKTWSSNAVKKLFGGKKTVTKWEDVEQPVELKFNLSSKYLPVVYGVQKVQGNPVFVDTNINDPDTDDYDESSYVYIADTICEGPIVGVFDIRIDGASPLCVDAQDQANRGSGGDHTMPCYANAKYGEVLGGFVTARVGDSDYEADISSADGVGDLLYARRTERESVSIPIYESIHPKNSRDDNLFTASFKGIGQNRTVKFHKPQEIIMDFYNGTSEQRASDRLVEQAALGQFKLQNDYYSGSPDYWTVNHRLLDTAYMVNRFFITEGNTTIPEIEYTVKGKMVNCFNYDGTFKITSGGNNFSLYDLNDTVDLYDLDDTKLNSTSYRVGEIFEIDTIETDRLSHWTDGGIGSEKRMKFQTTDILDDIGDEKKFYIRLSGDANSKIYLQTWDADVFTLSSDIDVEPITAPIISVKNVADGDTTNHVQVLTPHTSTMVKVVSAFPTGHTFVLGFKNNTTGRIYHTRVSSPKPSTPSGTGDLYVTFTFNTSGRAQGWASYEEFKNIHDDIANGDDVDVVITNIIDVVNNESLTDFSVGQKLNIKTGDYSQELLLVDIEEDATHGNFFELAPEAPMLDTSVTSQVTSMKEGFEGDLRPTLNPAMQLLDYLTSDRYGKGLDIDNDIDLDSFLEAARDCDETSKITIVTKATQTEVTEGDVYRYYDAVANGDTYWVGTVDKVTNVTFEGTNYRTIRFKDCFGKLIGKLNESYDYGLRQLLYTGSKLYQTNTSGYIGAGTNINNNTYTQALADLSNHTTELTAEEPFSLTKVSGAAGSPDDLNVFFKSRPGYMSASGNPIIRDFVNSTQGFRGSGYSLYDSDDVDYWKLCGWNDDEQHNVTRHQCSMAIDTSLSIFDNVNAILSQFNGQLTFTNGKYSLSVEKAAPGADSVIINSTTYKPAEIHKDDIIGQLKVVSKAVKDTFNTVTTRIVDPSQGFNNTDISFFNSDYLKQDRGIPKTSNISYPGITNYYNARLNIRQKLDQSRAGLSISFTTKPQAALLKAGDFVYLTHDEYGFDNKEFRITSLEMLQNGLVSIAASEHNKNSYLLEGEVDDPIIKIGFKDNGEQAPTIPIRPSSVAAAVAPQKTLITWTNDSDFDPAKLSIEIWRSTTDLSPVYSELSGMEKVATIGGGTEWADTTTQIDANETYYYYLRYADINAYGYFFSVTRARYYYGRFTSSVSAAIPPLNANNVNYGSDGTGGTIEALKPEEANANNTLARVDAGITVNSGGVTFATTPTGAPAIKAGQTEFDDADAAGFFLGYDTDAYKFSIGNADNSQKLTFDGSNLVVSGDISASTGTLSNNITIGTGDDIFKASSVGIQLGDATFADAPFSVNMQGDLVASGANVSGVVTATTLSVTDPDAVQEITAKGVGENAITEDSFGSSAIAFIQAEARTAAGGSAGVNELKAMTTVLSDPNFDDGDQITDLDITNLSHGTNDPIFSIIPVFSIYTSNDYTGTDLDMKFKVYARTNSPQGSWTALNGGNELTITATKQFRPWAPAASKFHYYAYTIKNFTETTLTDNTDYDFKVEVTKVPVWYDSDTVAGAGSISFQVIEAGANATLAGLADVTLTSEAAKETLVYAGSNWENTDVLAIDTTNNRVGVNDTTPSVALEVIGEIKASGNITAYSDERLKDDIKTLDGKKVLEMRGVEFTKDGEKGSGVVAQELEKVAPELVANEGKYKSVAYGNLVGYLIEAVKDLQKQVDELKK